MHQRALVPPFRTLLAQFYSVFLACKFIFDFP